MLFLPSSICFALLYLFRNGYILLQALTRCDLIDFPFPYMNGTIDKMNRVGHNLNIAFFQYLQCLVSPFKFRLALLYGYFIGQRE